MTDFDRDILNEFLVETSGYLPSIRAGLASFRTAPPDAGMLDEFHRCVHTIKGASGMVGLPELSRVASRLEDVVERFMNDPTIGSPEVLDGMSVAVGHIEGYLAVIATGERSRPALADLAERDADQLAALLPALQATRINEGYGHGSFEADLSLPHPPDEISDEMPAPLEAAEVESHPGSGVGSSDLTNELLEVFRLEADEHLRVLTTLLPEAHTDPSDPERWQSIRRAAHTLKGSAGLVGFDNVTQLAHRMEDLFDMYFEGTRRANSTEIDALLAASDAISEMVDGRSNPASFAAAHARLDAILGVRPEAATAVVSRVEAAPAPVPARAAREAAEATVRVSIHKLDEIAKLVGELVIARTTLEQRVGELSRLLSEASPTTARLARVSGKLETGYEASELAGGADVRASDDGHGFDSLELDRYTEFHLLSRELAETTTDVQTVFGEFGHLLGEVDGQITRQARLSGEVEDKLMRLRMVPLSTIAAKLQRTARTAAATAGRQVEFVLDGERTGLDKAVLDAMADPLLHLLRNAVDHGLEPPEVRLALGKAERGMVSLAARHEGNYVTLRLTDDGRGIDFERVRSAVASRGLASLEQAAVMSTEELAAMLFRPGFSTRDTISELSGRGVGLDEVKSKVESLKGFVSVDSELGRGTTFTIRLPMTLAVVRALLVKAAGQTFAIPLESVESILRPGDGDIDRVGRNPVLRSGGAVCPLVPLAQALRLKQADEAVEGNRPVVVLSVAGRRVALQIDRLLGGREVVIKGLARHLRHVAAVSGATLLGDGSVVLILNPAELSRVQAGPNVAHARSVAPLPQAREGHSVLVVDDSPSVRRVLTMLLTGAGWRVTTAKDGLEALEILQRGDHPDVVLTDVEMPRMDGYELLSTVRAQASLSHLPVAVLTSRAADKHRRKALDLGASAYVLKPYRDENLFEILSCLVRPTRSEA